jgi:DNA-directed RNA polymerase subunit F
LKYPLRNIIYEKIQQLNNITDSELTSILSKEGIELDSAELNKILLDLEIYGLLKVSWISKDKRRIELLR